MTNLRIFYLAFRSISHSSKKGELVFVDTLPKKILLQRILNKKNEYRFYFFVIMNDTLIPNQYVPMILI